MASLRQQRPDSPWIVMFRWSGQQFNKSCGTKVRRDAERKKESVNETLYLLRTGRLEVPEDVNVGEWIFNGGKVLRKASPKRKPAGRGIDDLIAKYLDHRRLLVDSGQLSQSSYSSDVFRLQDFQRFCQRKRKTSVEVAFSAESLNAYRVEHLKAMSTGRSSAANTKHCLRTVKACVEWCYDEEHIDTKPRKMKKYATITLPTPKLQFFTVDQVQTLYTNATGPLKAWIALAINCGYTQADLATLDHDMIDFGAGIIKRDRHKTTVDSEHKLWPCTLRLLKEHATNPNDSSLVFLSPNGQPLLAERIKDNGKPTRTDSVRLAFRNLRAKLDGEFLTFKYFRKTGSDAIARQYQKEPWLVDLYLSHASGKMSKHYARQHYDRLHEATDWLATVYDLQ